MTKPAPSRNEVIEALRNGDRDPVDDADDVSAIGGAQGVELTHQASNGTVILHYNYYTAYEANTTGQTDEFDFFDNE